MTFSIIVPIYNVEKYIKKCVNSLLVQTYNDIEIILVDDGSTDECPSICDQFCREDKRVQVIHKVNGGLSEARNVGIDSAKGEYVIFVDADDYVEADMCETFLPFVAQGVQVIIGDAISEGSILDLSHVKMKGIATGKEYLLEAYRQQKAPMAAWLNVIKKSFLLENNLKFKCGILHEDEDFTPRVLLKAQSVITTNKVFYHYVIRNDSITTRKDKRKNAHDLYATCCELEKLYRQLDDAELKSYLLDSLSYKYLIIFQAAKLHQYGDVYIHKDFVLRNARTKRTKCKVILYCISPKMYYYLNDFIKKVKLHVL